jgi:uncharacterized protein (TIGR01777 family)
MRVFVTGGTGLVGKLLVRKLRERGDLVVLLTRRPDAVRLKFGDGVSVVGGDPVQPGPWMDAVKDCDAVVHLAGEGIFNRRWTQAFKDEIYATRVKGTDNIVAALGKPDSRAKILVSASAIGYYGPHGDEELTEDGAPGNDFLAKVCVDWEKAALPATLHGVRVVHLRTGIVLDANGGALAKMLTPFKMFVGGPIGSGKQWMSWIHIEDEVGLILFALDNAQITGALNAVAPRPVTNKDFGNVLGKVLGRPSFMPTPAFALRILVGEGAEIITSGQKVLPKKALDAGYVFKFTDLEPALRNLLAK